MLKNLLLVVLISISSFSQNKNEIDSLYAIVNSTKNDSVKVALLNKIAFYYIFNDSKKANEVLKKSEKIALSKKELYGQNEIINIKGIFNDISGNSDSAFHYFKQSLAFSKKHRFPVMQARSVNNLGMYNYNRGNWNEALRYFFEALKINEKLPKEKKINESICLSNIGLIYQEMKLFDKAIAYHNKAYAIRVKDNLLKEQAISLDNIGICYRNKKDYNQAISSFKKGIEVANASDNIKEKAKIIVNLASVYIDREEYTKALSYYLEAEQLRANLETSLKERLLLNSYIARCYTMLKDYSLSLSYSKKALEILNQDASLRTYSADLFWVTASTYYALGNVDKGNEFITQYNDVMNEVFSSENSKHITELETKYQTEKKEKELLIAKNQLFQEEIQSKKKTNWLYIISIFALFSILFGYLYSRQQKLKNQQQEQEFQLKTAIAQIETQNQLQNQRLSISRDLHDNIGAQLTFIISSVENIKHGFTIENSKLLDKLNTIANFSKNTIVELRDTIWALNHDEISFEELHGRINNFIENAQNSQSNVAFSFRIDEKLNHIKLTSIQGVNSYRTIQEAINNALKYAEATEIGVAIHQEKEQIKIQISDNGKGFNLINVSSGNGLKNMKKRIQEINGSFSIDSSDKGTVISILI